jgi:hypothetical protein
MNFLNCDGRNDNKNSRARNSTPPKFERQSASVNNFRHQLNVFFSHCSYIARTFSPVSAQTTPTMAPYSISPTIEQQVMWPMSGHNDDFLGSGRTGKLPEFQRLANFSAQPKNTHYTANFNQVSAGPIQGRLICAILLILGKFRNSFICQHL